MQLPPLTSNLFAAHAKLLRRTAGTTLLLLSIAALARVESTPTLAELARRAPVIQANHPPRIDDVRFVAATGLLTSPILIGDDAYLRPGPFAAVRRRTEMFSWTQGRDGDAPTYVMGWSETPENSADFDVPEGHQNPVKPLTSRSFVTSDARVGVYKVDLGSLALPPFQSLELAEKSLQGNDMIVLPDALFVGKGTVENPRIGDLRIRYEVIPQTVTVTAFGQVNAGRLQPFVAPHGLRLYHLFYGSRESALHKLDVFAGPSPALFRALALVAVWLSLTLLTRQLRIDPRLERLPFAARITLLSAAALALIAVTVGLSIAAGALWAPVLLSMLIVFALLFLDVRHRLEPLAPTSVPMNAAVKPAPARQPAPSPAPLSIAVPAAPIASPPPSKIATAKTASKPLSKKKVSTPKRALKPKPSKSQAARARIKAVTKKPSKRAKR